MLIKTKPKSKKRYFSFNLNENIRFKLTPEGFKIHKLNWETLNLKTRGGLAAACPYEAPKVDSEGFTEDQMWHVMREYGGSLFDGCNPLFLLTFQIASDDLFPVKRAKGKR